jgi:UPF0755 protein
LSTRLRNWLHALIAITLVLSISFSYIWQNIFYKPLKMRARSYTFEVSPGTSLRQFTTQLYDAGILLHPYILRWYAVYKGYANSIKAGEYIITHGSTPIQLLNKVIHGDVAQYSFTIIEGSRSDEVIQALQNNPKISATLQGLSEQQIINRLAIPAVNLEGLFLPDTYNFTAHTTDIDFLRRAYLAMQKRLQAEWDSRAQNLIIKTPYEALILASIIEKESGLYTEYPEISGVYHRRLAKHMRLQADPTVIYALGNNYRGQLFKSDLKYDSRYNTYRYAGLPPTPIAIPSANAIAAALHPAAGESLYFVANGSGGHTFSKDLAGHNEAVQGAASLRNSK